MIDSGAKNELIPIIYTLLARLLTIYSKIKAKDSVRAGGGICNGGEGNGGRRRRGEDDTNGHHSGDDTSRGRAPEQIPGLDAGEALHPAQRLRALVPARGHRYLERYAPSHAGACIN